jgi:hypothetical protein
MNIFNAEPKLFRNVLSDRIQAASVLTERGGSSEASNRRLCPPLDPAGFRNAAEK